MQKATEGTELKAIHKETETVRTNIQSIRSELCTWGMSLQSIDFLDGWHG